MMILIKKNNKVINACQSDKDFENLKHGDKTEVVVQEIIYQEDRGQE